MRLSPCTKGALKNRAKMKIRTIDFVWMFVIVLLLVLLRNGCHQQKQFEDMHNAVQDSLIFAQDELGRQKTTTMGLYADKATMLMKIKTKDSTINWLQDVVKDYDGRLNSAIVVSNVTETKEVVREVTVESVDTIVKDSIKYVYPEYSIDWVNEWEQGVIVANKDSIYRDIQFFNEFEITLGEQRNRWFKPREFMVNVKNLNPMTKTKELKSFSVKSKPKRFVLALHLGGGIDFLTMKPTFYAGVGVGFVLVEIK